MLRHDLIRTVLMLMLCALCLCRPGASMAQGEHSQTRLRLLLTSNIQGRSNASMETPHLDPLLVLAQNIVSERQKGVDLYMDLGNAFYPGVISKFSSGSIMMDFLEELGCEATLVSSMDLQVGVKNLEFLQKDKSVRLLSANITHAEGTVFAPYFITTVRGTPIAFVAISSDRLDFDIAEKDLYDIGRMHATEALRPVVEEIDKAGVTHIVLLTGLDTEATIQLLDAFPQIDLALCGGDATGILYDGKASRIDLVDGRSILMLNENDDYFTLDVMVGEGLHPLALHPRKALPQKTDDAAYARFAERLALWKTTYLAAQERQIAEIGEAEYTVDDYRLAQLLRDRFNTEIAIVGDNTLNPHTITRDVRKADLLGLVNLDYNIFTFSISGRELKTLMRNVSLMTIVGVSEGKTITVQSYPVEDHRKYKVAATQPAFEKVARLLGKEIPFKNSWTTVSSLLSEDLGIDRITLRQDYTYLDNRFRTMFDVYLSNFMASGSVSRSEGISTPVSQPAKSYRKWGLEDKIDWTIYNQSHRFVLTPYLFYVRQDDDYIQNLLRGTILYEYNLSESLRPYNKFQVDTVVESIEGLRPMLIRETLGVSAYFTHWSGRLGFGFEKRVQDPSEDALFGLELIVGLKYPFLTNYTYIFGIDNFVSIKNGDGAHWGLRSSIDNALSIRINDYLSISLKHKYFYLHEDELDREYRSSQFFTTVDVRTDWKFW
ncbi:MAG: hypothetical protein KFF50_08335 [Desulfatitalea sp.]|nr:hypothetical protein [Desulfatitalea sp.]